MIRDGIQEDWSVQAAGIGLGISAFSITTTLRLAMESTPPYPHVGELKWS